MTTQITNADVFKTWSSFTYRWSDLFLFSSKMSIYFLSHTSAFFSLGLALIMHVIVKPSSSVWEQLFLVNSLSLNDTCDYRVTEGNTNTNK